RGEDSHAHVHPDPGVGHGDAGLDGPLDEHPEGDHQTGPPPRDCGRENPRPALADEPLQLPVVLMDPYGPDPREGDVPAVGFDPDRASGEGRPIPVAALLREPREPDLSALTCSG